MRLPVVRCRAYAALFQSHAESAVDEGVRLVPLVGSPVAATGVAVCGMVLPSRPSVLRSPAAATTPKTPLLLQAARACAPSDHQAGVAKRCCPFDLYTRPKGPISSAKSLRAATGDPRVSSA